MFMSMFMNMAAHTITGKCSYNLKRNFLKSIIIKKIANSLFSSTNLILFYTHFIAS